eukprot:scaffold4406_cov112-Isochrysis_galbana.AAC.7
MQPALGQAYGGTKGGAPRSNDVHRRCVCHTSRGSESESRGARLIARVGEQLLLLGVRDGPEQRQPVDEHHQAGAAWLTPDRRGLGLEQVRQLEVEGRLERGDGTQLVGPLARRLELHDETRHRGPIDGLFTILGGGGGQRGFRLQGSKREFLAMGKDGAHRLDGCDCKWKALQLADCRGDLLVRSDEVARALRSRAHSDHRPLPETTQDSSRLARQPTHDAPDTPAPPARPLRRSAESTAPSDVATGSTCKWCDSRYRTACAGMRCREKSSASQTTA